MEGDNDGMLFQTDSFVPCLINRPFDSLQVNLVDFGTV